MLRDKNLVPLSRQHQHALALCVRIERASVGEADLAAWQREIAQHFQNEIAVHFAAEEAVLFPTACEFQELTQMVQELLKDHVALREYFRRAENQKMSRKELSDFAKRMAGHIRKEERQLFESMQKLMDANNLARIGKRLDEALSEASQACIVLAEATKKQPR